MNILFVNGYAPSTLIATGGTVFKAAGNGVSVIGLVVDIPPNGGIITSSQNITGRIKITGPNMSMSGGVLEIGGVEVAGNFTQTGGTVLLDTGMFTVDGIYQETGGSIDLGPGSLTVLSGLQIAAGAEVFGSGVITADVTNAGLIDVGGPGNPGLITIASNSQLGIGGNYTQSSSGTLHMEVFSSAAFDQLAIDGMATLGGTLNVDWLGGSTPPPLGSDFPLLTYASRVSNSEFGTVNLPTFGDRRFDPRYDDPNAPDAFSLWVVPL